MAGKKYGVISLPLVAKRLDTGHCSKEQVAILEYGHVIYIYYGQRSFYVGQTDRFLTRHKEHMAEVKTDYRQFEKVVVLFGQYVDGNSQNDLEALLITYLTADQENLPRKEKRVCRNRTRGNQFVDYPNREEVLARVLTPFWEQELSEAGLVRQKSLDGLRNSILFKYSPFAELSEEQSELIREIEEGTQSFLIEGTAGTGKTVVLTNLAARLCEHHDWNVGVVVKSNWVKTARSIFRAYGLGKNIAVGTAYQLIRQQKRFHILLVDEAHRLRWNSPKQNHLTTGIFDPNDPRKNELFLLGELTDRLVLLYDAIQAIRPSDIPYRDFQDYVQEKHMERRMLTKQFRVRVQDKDATYTSDDYINGICSFLQIKESAFDPGVFQNPSEDAYFGVVDSIHELFDYNAYNFTGKDGMARVR